MNSKIILIVILAILVVFGFIHLEKKRSNFFQFINFDFINNQTIKNDQFITEIIESESTLAQVSYNCGAKGCFEEAFVNCDTAMGIDEVFKPYSQKTRYEIIGLSLQGCKVETTFEKSLFSNWEGKSIICELDNSLSITEAVAKIYQPNGSENLNCYGELMVELEKYGY